MRISAKAEYACQAMLELATNFTNPQPVHVKSIADAHEIPQGFLVQILLQLKGAGLVVSARGASGGYQLARPPAAISLADVIGIIDAAPGTRPIAAEESSGSPTVQALRAVWREVQAKERTLLEACTLAELVRRTQMSSALSYQI